MKKRELSHFGPSKAGLPGVTVEDFPSSWCRMVRGSCCEWEGIQRPVLCSGGACIRLTSPVFRGSPHQADLSCVQWSLRQTDY